MIGHDHVAPNSNIKFAHRAMSVLLKSKLGAIHRGNTSAVASRNGDEVEWLIDVNQIKSMRTVLDHSSNRRGSRVGCNNLDCAGDTPAAAGRCVTRAASARNESIAAAETSTALERPGVRHRLSLARELLLLLGVGCCR